MPEPSVTFEKAAWRSLVQPELHVFVLPAWGPEPVFVHAYDQVEHVRYVALSPGMWERLCDRCYIETGRPLDELEPRWLSLRAVAVEVALFERCEAGMIDMREAAPAPAVRTMRLTRDGVVL